MPAGTSDLRHVLKTLYRQSHRPASTSDLLAREFYRRGFVVRYGRDANGRDHSEENGRFVRQGGSSAGHPHINTPEFKKWFGDWDTAVKWQRVERLTPIKVDLSGFSGTDSESVRSKAGQAYEALGSATNIHDGKKIHFPNNAFRKMRSHSADLRTVKIVPALHDLAEQAIHLYDEPERHGRRNIDRWHTYAGKANLDGEPLYVRLTTYEQNGVEYLSLHDTHILPESEMQKAAPGGPFSEANRGESQAQPSGKETLRDFYRQSKESSKVVNPDGTPKVVYHGTTAGGFDSFSDANKKGLSAERREGTHYFTGSPENADSYAATDDAVVPAADPIAELPEGAKVEARWQDWKDKSNPDFPWKFSDDFSRSPKKGIEYHVRLKNGNVVDNSNASTPEQARADAIQSLNSGPFGIFGGRGYGQGSAVMPMFLNIRNPYELDAEGKSFHGRIGAAIDEAKRLGHDGVIVKNVIDSGGSYGTPQTTYVAFDPSQIKSASGNRGSYDSSQRHSYRRHGLVEQFNREFARRGIVARYKANGQWITIGGGPDGEKQHAGGTPVRISESGHIEAGPAALEGRHIADLSGKRSKADTEPARSGRSGGDTGGLAGLRVSDLIGHEDQVQALLAILAGRQSPNPHVQHLPDGRRVGPAQMSVDDLRVDPGRFQYKVQDIDQSTGTNAELKEVRTYNPEFGGQLLVWHDPADNQTYVVNGHHRHELAKRAGYQGPLSVFYVNAKDARDARAHGAMANIAEGRGTAVDAAKFLRDSGQSLEDLKRAGISVRGATAERGIALSKLSDGIFQKLTRGQIREGRAMALVAALGDQPATQDKLLRYIEKREGKGKGKGRDIPDAVVQQMARDAAMAPVRKKSGTDLFGDFEEDDNLFLERNQLKAWLREQLSDESRAFQAVSSEGRKSRLEGTGTNQIDVEGNRNRAAQARAALDTFDRLAHLKGPLSDILNDHAKELPHANARERKAVQQRAFERVAESLRGDDGSGLGAGAEERGRDAAVPERARFGRSWRPDGNAVLTERFARAFGRVGVN